MVTQQTHAGSVAAYIGLGDHRPGQVGVAHRCLGLFGAAGVGDDTDRRGDQRCGLACRLLQDR
jgi:hypothetical protein